MISRRVKTIIYQAPAEPGVYFFSDCSNNIIYIGKAKSLKNRLMSYLSSHDEIDKTAIMLNKAMTVHWIIANSEADALVLEAQQIKKHRPEFNFLLKDDKNFPYVRISINDEWPSVKIVRKLTLDDGNLWLGPFTESGTLKKIFLIARRIFKLRTCNKISTNRACLQYHLGNCLAPCCGNITLVEYNERVRAVAKLFSGKIRETQQYLMNKMQQMADSWNFELAEQYRIWSQTIKALAKMNSKVNANGSFDCIAIATENNRTVAFLLQIRDGYIVNQMHYFFDNEMLLEDELSDAEYTKKFIAYYYLTVGTDVPPQILLYLNSVAKDVSILEQAILIERRKATKISIPRRGAKYELCIMAMKNALDYIARQPLKRPENWYEQGQRELTERLRLKFPLKRIECFDISHHSGIGRVASQVVMCDGVMKKKSYRRYKLQQGINDDFAAMNEVINRRLATSHNEKPDLIIIDGGRGQLSAVSDICKSMGISVIAIAKRDEEIFTIDEYNAIKFSPSSYAVQIVKQCRDEAHRFAVSYHRILKRRRHEDSVLSKICGLGRVKANRLLKECTSVAQIRKMSIDDLEKINGIGDKLAKKIFDYFQREDNKDG